MDDLLIAAELACEAAVKSGAEFSDALVDRARLLSVSVDKNAISSSDASRQASISVRAFVNGGTGWCTMSTTSEETALLAGREAAALAKAAEPDPDFVSLVSPEPCADICGLHDNKLANMAMSDVADWIAHNIDSAQGIAPDALVSGKAESRRREQVLANSLGVRAVGRMTSAFVYVQVIIRENGLVGTFYEWDAARRLDDFAPFDVGAKAATEALKYLKSRPMNTKTMPVVLAPLATQALFSGLCLAASAEDVQRKRSYLVGKKGAEVASEHVTIVDDPLASGGLYSAKFDGDGYPHRTLTIVDRGILQTYLHSHYTARKSGEPNTGHATRTGIAPTNLRLKPGQQTAAELIGEVEDGIYVTLGEIVPDIASGQISAVVDAGFRIERGELTYPLEKTMVAGHAIDVLRNVDAVSSDYREEPGLVLPTVRVSAMRVASDEQPGA